MNTTSLMCRAFVVAGLAACVYAQESPKMYLCADSLSKDSADKKLIYGYIDGKKTGCMTEYEFLALFNQEEFARDSVARAQKDKESMQKARVSASPADTDTLAELIRKGKKDLDAADLMKIDLSGADLSQASLVSADLRRAKLSKANLSGANLDAAYLRRADLRGANLEGANLKSAYLAEADLRGAKGLTIEMLKSVATLHKALLDEPVLEQVKVEAMEKLKPPSKCWENNRWTDNEDCNAEKGLVNPAKVK